MDGVITVFGTPQPLYPTDREGTTYGGDTCASWDQDLPPYCADDAGKPVEGAAEWCAAKYCYVDPRNCDIANTKSTYFPLANAYYSYATCGAKDTYSATSLLPGSTLALKIFNTNGTGSPEIVAQFKALVESTPTLIGVVGPLYSSAAVAIGTQIADLKIPFCSYGASSAQLTSSERFPWFVRTNPSNVNNAAAVAVLAKTLAWTRVAILTSDDAYAGDMGAKLAVALGNSAVIYRGAFRGDTDGGKWSEVLKHAREILRVGARVIFIDGSFQSEVDKAVDALAAMICGDGENAVAPAAIPIGCFKGFGIVTIGKRVRLEGTLLVEPSKSYAAYAYDSVQAIVRAFAPALAGSIASRRFLNASSVVQLREATMKNLRMTNLNSDATRSGALTFNVDNNDRTSDSLQYDVKKRLMSAEAFGDAVASGVVGAAETSVTVASILGKTVLFNEPAWSTTRWPGLGDTLPLDRPAGTIPKMVHVAMVVAEDDATHLTAAQQAVAEINAKATYRVHRLTTMMLHYRAVPVGGDYATTLEELVETLRVTGTHVSCLLTKWSGQTAAVKKKSSLRYIPAIAYAASVSSLSSMTTAPHLIRMLPPDTWSVHSLVKIMRKYGWTRAFAGTREDTRNPPCT